MGNVLKTHRKTELLTLVRAGHSFRDIEERLGVRRETVSKYAREAGLWPFPKAATVPKVATGFCEPASKPATPSLEVATGFGGSIAIAPDAIKASIPKQARSRAVNWWLQWQRGEGKRSIEARKTSGRPPLLNAKQREALRTLLLKGAAAAGFDTDLWTCPRVREVIRRTFGITYHVDHVCRLLHALGFTPQKPERKAVERNEQAIRQWVSHQWPSIKKKPSKRRRPSPSSTKRAS